MTAQESRSRQPKQLDGGMFQTEISSFALGLAAEGKAAKTIRTYTEAVQWTGKTQVPTGYRPCRTIVIRQGRTTDLPLFRESDVRHPGLWPKRVKPTRILLAARLSRPSPPCQGQAAARSLREL